MDTSQDVQTGSLSGDEAQPKAKKGVKGALARKSSSQKAGSLADSGKVLRRQDKSDNPINNRHVTAKTSKTNGLQGAVHDDCKQNEFEAGIPYRFKPGQSGNPSGRPSALRAFTLDTVKERLGRVDPKLDKSALERIVDHSIRLALQGSYDYTKLMLAYGLGQPRQAVEMETTVSYASEIDKARKRVEQHEQECMAALTPQERATLDALNAKMSKASSVALPSPTSGHSDAETVQGAETTSQAPVVPEGIKRIVM